MNKNLAYDVTATTLENAMLQLGASASNNVNSGVYKMNDVTSMTKAGQWNVQTPTYDRENQITTIANQPNIISPVIRSGRMILNGNFAGMYDFVYHDGDLDLSQQTQMGGSHLENLLFSGNQDTHWALIYINGDLTVDAAVQIKPNVRKLGMCIYVAGDCIVDGLVSMTNRGANHSGKGTSGGYTVPVAIPLNGTLTIPATGGAGGARAGPTVRTAGSGTWLYNNGAAAGGSSTGTYCGSGGGASGAASHYDGTTNGGVYSGKGGDGTCFSGGSGGAGILEYNANGAIQGAANFDEFDAIEYGGAGGHACSRYTWPYPSWGGVGNPAGLAQNYWDGNEATVTSRFKESGENIYVFPADMQEEWNWWATSAYRDDSRYSDPNQNTSRGPNNYNGGMEGTGGTLVMMITGQYSGAGAVRATGHAFYTYDDTTTYAAPGGASGGGIGIVLYGTDSSGPTPSAAGGVAANAYPGAAGGAGTGLKASL